MKQSSLVRRALTQIHHHVGPDAVRRIAVRYNVEEVPPDELEDAIAAAVHDDLDQLVLETAAWGLPIWVAVVRGIGGPEPTNAEQVISSLTELLDLGPSIPTVFDIDATTRDPGALDEDDDEPTGYPRCEELSTDAVLPWTRTQLTSFQRRGARLAFDAMFRQKKPTSLLCLPDGSGRTRTAADVVLGACVAKGSRAIWIRSSRVLLDQVQDEIRELAWLVGELGTHRSTFSISRLGSQHCDASGDVILAGLGALARTGITLEEMQRHGPISLICIDDAFMLAEPRVRATLQLLLRPGVHLFGLTGTPLQASDPDSAAMLEVFTEGPAFQLGFRELVEDQFLARPVFLRKRLGSTRDLPIPKEEIRAGFRDRKDFSGTLLRAMAQQPGRTREILGHWFDHRDKYGATLVFAYDRNHAEAMSGWLTGRGIPNDFLFPDMEPAKRTHRLTRFRRHQSDVLVLAGLLTEGEQVPAVQTVVLARPTLSPTLYKHMVGHGARRSPTLKKAVFYVVDCIDDFHNCGVSLAGRTAAVELDEEFEDTTTMVVPAEVLRHRDRQHRALVSTRAWQILRRFADDQYSVWGELVWALPNGGEKSVIVFHEGVARLRSAVDMVEAAMINDDLLPLREMGKELDWLGAVRNVDWQEMLGDCAETGKPPRLQKGEQGLVPDVVEACGRILAQLVEEMLSGRMTIHAAMKECDSLLADSEPLQALFASVIELRQELLKLYHDAVSRVEVVGVTGEGDRQEVVDAFVRFTVGIAMADKVLHESEARAIVKAVERMFDLSSDDQRQWVVSAMERYRDQELEPWECGEKLRAKTSRAELFHMYDWLFRVAFADGVFVEQERKLLHEAAAALGIPKDEVAELENRYTATLHSASTPPPASVSPSMILVPKLRYCTQCGYTRELGAAFCVSCGSELPATP